MKHLIVIVILLLPLVSISQRHNLKIGDHFPDLMFRPIVNAPFKVIDINSINSKKLYIINFWGTWCSPCIPQMKKLSLLQKKYNSQIQIIGVSNDPLAKLRKYKTKNPSGIWLASDTSNFLYELTAVNSVDQCLIINSEKKIVGFFKTDTVNSKLITQLLAGKKVSSNAEFKGVKLTNGDAFGVDSTLNRSFSFRGFMEGKQTMSQRPKKGPFALRRISFYNLPLPTMYRTAYGINSEKQIVFEADKKKYNNFDDKMQRYCLDLLVDKTEADSLLPIMQRKLAEVSPLKGRIEKRMIPVYVLKIQPNSQVTAPLSTSEIAEYIYDGNGFKGTGISLSDFANDYLTNGLDRPVINETGITTHYNITTTNDISDKQNILAAVKKLGLTVEKAERLVPLLILSEKPINHY